MTLKEENQLLKRIIFNLVKFIELPPVQEVIDGAFDPSIYVFDAKKIINYDKMLKIEEKYWSQLEEII